MQKLLELILEARAHFESQRNYWNTAAPFQDHVPIHCARPRECEPQFFRVRLDPALAVKSQMFLCLSFLLPFFSSLIYLRSLCEKAVLNSFPRLLSNYWPMRGILQVENQDCIFCGVNAQMFPARLLPVLTASVAGWLLRLRGLIRYVQVSVFM